MRAKYTVACRTNPSHYWVADAPPNEYEDRCPECGGVGLTNYGRRIVEADDVEAESRYPAPEKIDWEELIDRLDGGGIDFGDSSETPAIRKLQREVRAARRFDG